ncbi:hypothetical protein PROFUN_00834 [Planoprotostelium fungivorum]|uniref:Uncharacterized protein n=1 Tax=Planoprotostelium fungivorum TaxID=1890364 RepID=A0A2P6P049_9EUKA|nr:hypothetical protein PROFUN_00834 [Planoprotostelium fungivorum]
MILTLGSYPTKTHYNGDFPCHQKFVNEDLLTPEAILSLASSSNVNLRKQEQAPKQQHYLDEIPTRERDTHSFHVYDYEETEDECESPHGKELDGYGEVSAIFATYGIVMPQAHLLQQQATYLQQQQMMMQPERYASSSLYNSPAAKCLPTPSFQLDGNEDSLTRMSQELKAVLGL